MVFEYTFVQLVEDVRRYAFKYVSMGKIGPERLVVVSKAFCFKELWFLAVLVLAEGV